MTLAARALARPAVLALVCLAAGCTESSAPPPPAVPDAAVADALAGRFPETLGGLARTSVQTDTDAALGASVASAAARYGADNSTGAPSVEVFVTDYGTAEMSEMMGLAWGVGGELEYEAGSEARETIVFDGHPARRTWDRERRTGRLQVLADETLFVEVRAEGVDAGVLDAAARAGLGSR